MSSKFQQLASIGRAAQLSCVSLLLRLLLCVVRSGAGWS